MTLRNFNAWFGMLASPRAITAAPRIRANVVAFLTVLGFCLLAAEVSWAQPKPDTKPRSESGTTADGWKIAFTYYPSADGKEASCVILLHGQGENQLVWEKNGLALRLQEAGFAVVTVDVRKHGQSKHATISNDGPLNQNDWRAIAAPGGDLETVKTFLMKEHTADKLNIEQLGVIAAGDMAPAVLTWTAADWLKKPYNDAPTFLSRTPRGQDVKAVVLLSPNDIVPGLGSAAALRTLVGAVGWARANLNPDADLAFLIMHSEIRNDIRSANSIYRQLSKARGAKDRVVVSKYKGQLRGTDLVRKNAANKAQPLILGFLKKHLQDLKLPHRNRISRALRD